MADSPVAASDPDSPAGPAPPAKPRVVISRCLNLAPVRYNGEVIRDAFAAQLAPFVEYVPVCPEVEIGLGVPRPTIKLVGDEHGQRLVQPKTGADLTETMDRFAAGFLDGLGEIDGFLLKARSPSCGIGNAKVTATVEKGPAVAKTDGRFAARVRERHPELAVIDEGRLNDAGLRHHFLSRLFGGFRWRRLRAAGPGIAELQGFHAANKLLMMAHSQDRMRNLGRIAANREQRPLDEVLAAYGEAYRELLAARGRHRNHLNVLEHAFGYVSEALTAAERQHFLDLLERFGDGEVALVVPLELLRSWVLRYDVAYLKDQTYFHPYPAPLRVHPKTSTKDRVWT